MMTTKNPEHIKDVITRVKRKLKERRRVVVRCEVCDRIYLAKPDSNEHREGLCSTCLASHGHLYRNHNYEV